jgi:hypothetical protein
MLIYPACQIAAATGVHHYKYLTPENLVPSLLHMEIGMVNDVWDSFQRWIDDDVERIPVDEKVACKSLAEVLP